MKVKPWPIIFKLIPALIAAVSDLSAALRKDSPGGKKLTKEESKQIASELLRRLEPVITEAVFKQVS